MKTISQISRRVVLSIALMPVLGQSAEPESVSVRPLIRFVSCTADATVMGQTYLSLGAKDQAAPIFHDASTCLDSNVETAISEAGDNAALVEAVKDFYAKAKAWVSAAPDGPRQALAAKQPFDAAKERLILEAKLAHKWA